jgi:hypothetical protein
MGKFDYNKKEFTQEEREILLRESEVLKEKHPDRIPILIQIDSNILKMEKNKFLVANDVSVNYYFDLLKRKLMDLSPTDTLVISVTKFEADGTRTLTPVKSQSKLLKDFYEEHYDKATGMLILTVSRSTTYKWVKSTVGYYLGY